MSQGLFDRDTLLDASAEAILGHQVLLALWYVVAGPHGRQEIDNKGQNVAGEDESDSPLEHRAGILLGRDLATHADTETDRESNLDDNEGQLDKETG